MSKEFGPTLLVSRAAIERCLTTEDGIAEVERVFRAHGEGQVAMPAKVTLDMHPFGLEASRNAMPAYVHRLNAEGIKWSGGYADNPSKHGLPYVMATILLDDALTGYPLAVMDGTFITNVRTGAAAAVCAKYLSPPDASHVAFIGAGVQARFATDAFVRTHGITRVSVYDISRAAAQRYAAYVLERCGVRADIADSPEDAVRDAEIVVAVTYANAPLVEGRWLKPGATAISMGSFQEFDDEFVLSADKIVVDSWEQCSHRGELKRFVADGRLDRAGVYAELGEIVAGMKPGRENDRERILCVPIGLGTHDVALARLVFDRIVAAGVDVPSLDFFE